MRHILIVASGVTLLTMLYYPSFVLHHRAHDPRLLRGKLVEHQANSFMRTFGHEGSESRELWPKKWFKSIIASFPSIHTRSLPAVSESPTNSSLNQHVFLTKELYKGSHVWAHPELCQDKSGKKAEGVRLLVVVTTSAAHRAARAAIRLTWGQHARAGVVLAFMLQRPSPQYLDQLFEEDSEYGDLIMGNNKDSSLHAALKTLSLLEWVGAYCPHAHALLKTNDDVFVNVPRLLDFITAPHRVNASRTIWGKVMYGMRPERNLTSSQYYVPRDEYPAHALPAFLAGAAYLVSGDAVGALYGAASDQRYLRLEDAFVTGVLADAARVHRVHADDFCGYNVRQYKCAIKNSVAFDQISYDQQFHLWQKMHDTTVVCRTYFKMKKKFSKDTTRRTRNALLK